MKEKPSQTASPKPEPVPPRKEGELELANQALQAEIAERRLAEAAAKAERQRLYDVLEALPVYVILLSKDYRVPFANKFFRERFGESYGKRCYEYLFQRAEPCENCETYKPLKTNAPHHWGWTGPDGRNYDIYDFPFTDSDGASMIMEMGIDITEVKKAQAALKDLNATLERRVTERTAALTESAERLRLAQEATDLEVWDFDPRRGVMQCEARLKAWWGLPAEATYTYDVWLAHLHPEDREAAVAEVRRSAEPDGPGRQDMEYRVVRPDGSMRWVGVHAQTHFAEVDGRRQAIRIIGTMQDITGRKRTEEEIRRHVEELRAANEELARFNHVAVDRELRMIELKKEVNALCAKAGQPARYALAFER